jgi:hypothetical protein
MSIYYINIYGYVHTYTHYTHIYQRKKHAQRIESVGQKKKLKKKKTAPIHTIHIHIEEKNTRNALRKSAKNKKRKKERERKKKKQHLAGFFAEQDFL